MRKQSRTSLSVRNDARRKTGSHLACPLRFQTIGHPRFQNASLKAFAAAEVRRAECAREHLGCPSMTQLVEIS
jgi:hypothetical protein